MDVYYTFELGLKPGAGLTNDLFFKGFGITGVRSVSKKLFVQVDVNYLHSKSTFNTLEIDGSVAEVSDIFNYLSIPATINLKTFNRPGINLILSAGVSFDYLLKGKRIRESTNYGRIEGSHSGSLDVYLDFGIGLYIPISSSYFIILKPQFLYWLNNNNSYSGPHDFGLKLQLLRNF